MTWGCAFLCRQSLLPYLSVWFTGFEDELVRNGIYYRDFSGIATLIVGAIVRFCDRSAEVERPACRGTDRVLGDGLFRRTASALIVAAILFFLDTFTGLSKSEDWSKSQLIPQFSCIIRWFFDYLQKLVEFLARDVTGSEMWLNEENNDVCAVLSTSWCYAGQPVDL